MLISVDLDEESKQYLDNILEKKQIDVSTLIKQLLREHADDLCVQKTADTDNDAVSEPQTIIERMGGMPDYFFEGPENLSDRDVRKETIAKRIRQSHEAKRMRSNRESQSQ